MRFIVDTNIVFSAILKPSGNISSIILNNPNLELITCNYLVEEINKHKGKLIRLTGYSEDIFETVVKTIYDRITFYSAGLIPDNVIESAKELTNNIDLDDYLFVAFALFFDAKLWSGDKVLTEGLKAKGIDIVATTFDVAIAIMK